MNGSTQILTERERPKAFKIVSKFTVVIFAQNPGQIIKKIKTKKLIFILTRNETIKNCDLWHFYIASTFLTMIQQ